MIHKTKQYLLFLYTVSTGLILTVVIAILAFSNYHQKEQYNQLLFQNLVSSFSFTIQNNPDLQNIGKQYANGSPLSFKILLDGKTIMVCPDDSSSTQRQLLEELENLLSSRYQTINEGKTEEEAFITPILRLSNQSGQSYYGAIQGLKRNDGSYVKIYLLYPTGHTFPLRSIILYLLLEFIGLLLFLITGKLLIDRIFKPVNQNIQNQKEFISYASHELKAPLAIIQASNSSSERLSTGAQTAISNACSSMNRLISDMLLLSTTENADMPLHLTSVEVSTMLIGVYETHLPLCRKTHHILQLNLPDDLLPEITLDEARIVQVLSILISNAISYSPSGSEITLSVYIENTRIIAKKLLCIRVIDHGIGIPDTEKKRIFDRFYRVDKSHKDKQHYGLGLSIAKNIILLHKGTLEVKDTEGGGSTFCITLPINRK